MSDPLYIWIHKSVSDEAKLKVFLDLWKFWYYLQNTILVLLDFCTYHDNNEYNAEVEWTDIGTLSIRVFL